MARGGLPGRTDPDWGYDDDSWWPTEPDYGPDPTPTGPATPTEDEGDEEGGGGGFESSPWGDYWSNFLGEDFFKRWLKGGFGFDPNTLRTMHVGLEDRLNEQMQRWREEGNLNLVGSGRLYGGTGRRWEQEMQEEYLSQLTEGTNAINIAAAQEELRGRMDFINSLMGYIGGERQWDISQAGLGLQGRGLDLQSQAMYMQLLLGLLGLGYG